MINKMTSIRDESVVVVLYSPGLTVMAAAAGCESVANGSVVEQHHSVSVFAESFHR